MPFRRIVHVDINSFFAIMLQQQDKTLRGKPLGVVKDVGRTCIIAASKEAKLCGVKTGCSLREARVLCPGIITRPADFPLYTRTAKTFRQLLSTFTPDVDVFSIDEAFLDITHMAEWYPDPVTLGRSIQQAVFRELGDYVTCNVGIASTRLLAKMIGEVSPKGSVMQVHEQERDALLARVSFADVCGIGAALQNKLHTLGVYSPYAIRAISDEELYRLFGPFWSRELRRISFGEDSHVLREGERPFQSHMKSVGRSITGYRLCDDEREIRSVFWNLCAEIGGKVRRMGLEGRDVSVFVVGSSRRLHGEGQSWHTHITLKHPISSTSDLFHVVYGKLYCSWKRTFPLIRFGVRLGKLAPKVQQLSLFTVEEKRTRLTQAIDALNDRYGLFTVYAGVLDAHKSFQPEITGYLGDKKYQLEEWVSGTPVPHIQNHPP